MNKEIAKQWVEALRSGKYEQGKHQLRSLDNKFCCLGVLCDIMGAKWKEFNDVYASEYNNSCNEQYLPESLRSILGLERSSELTLSGLNDMGKGFSFIADFLEQEYLKNG
jgi:hypothetical protein